MRGEIGAREVLQLGRGDLGAGDHEGTGAGQPVLGVADDRAFDDGGMGQQAVFDLGRGHPHAADLQQVVGPSAVVEVAVRVAGEQVARPHRVPGGEGLRRLLR